MCITLCIGFFFIKMLFSDHWENTDYMPEKQFQVRPNGELLRLWTCSGMAFQPVHWKVLDLNGFVFISN